MVIVPASVKVVSAKLVVRLQGAIVAVALASISVQLGTPALSVSNLIFRFTDGLNTLASDNFNVLPATPLPICFTLTLVLPATSPIFCAVVASANVGQVSANKLSHFAIASPAI